MVLQNANHIDMMWAGNKLAEYKPTPLGLLPMGANWIKVIEQGKEECEDGAQEDVCDNSDTDKEELGHGD
jgi:hypothetical protein